MVQDLNIWTSTSESLNLKWEGDYEQKAQILQGERAFMFRMIRLIVAKWCFLNTHGVEGLEHCSRLKPAKDVVGIRKRLKQILS